MATATYAYTAPAAERCLRSVTKSIFPELPLRSLFSRLLQQAPVACYLRALSCLLYLWSQEKPSEDSAWQTRIEPQP